ncbi:membrane hypothetical protein [Gammaproteobacteria bacterium]
MNILILAVALPPFIVAISLDKSKKPKNLILYWRVSIKLCNLQKIIAFYIDNPSCYLFVVAWFLSKSPTSECSFNGIGNNLVFKMYKYNIKKLFNLFSNEYVLMNILLLFIFLTRIIYVFYFTDYKNYLSSDAGGYWDRAIRHYRGEDIGFIEWGIWPTAPHIFLSWYFHILDYIGLENNKLIASLVANIIISTTACYFFYQSIKIITQKIHIALISTFCYSFFYPNIYFNAFILSEIPAISFFIISLYFIISPNNLIKLKLSGFFLILASSFKPAYIILSLPYAVYILIKLKWQWRNLFYLINFAIGFFMTALLLVWLNYNISKGENYSFSGRAGGINFFMKQCGIHELIYQGNHINFHFIPASNVHKSELGSFITQEPFHHEDYYYQLSKICIVKNSNIIIENIASLQQLFFGNMYPSELLTAKGFIFLMPISQFITYFLFLLSCFTMIITWKNKNIFYLKISSFLFTLILFELISFVSFNTDQRHLYSIVNLFFLLSIIALQQLKQFSYLSIFQFIKNYNILILLLFILFKQNGYFHPDKMRMLYKNLNEVSQSVINGTRWNEIGLYKLQEGITIYLEGIKYNRFITLSLDHNDIYKIIYLKNNKVIAYNKVGDLFSQKYGMITYYEAVPIIAVRTGYDMIIIKPIEGDERYSFGHLILN